jgi:hypothetical protein
MVCVVDSAGHKATLSAESAMLCGTIQRMGEVCGDLSDLDIMVPFPAAHLVPRLEVYLSTYRDRTDEENGVWMDDMAVPELRALYDLADFLEVPRLMEVVAYHLGSVRAHRVLYSRAQPSERCAKYLELLGSSAP